jgi:hypothetical protein
MARGVNQGTVNSINTQLGNTNQLNNQLMSNNNAIQAGVLGGYQNLVANPGYDAATKSAITNASQGAAGTAYASAGDALARRAARTNNSSGVIAGMDQLARDKASTMSGIADTNQIQFADQAKKDVNTGLAGQAGLYGVDTNLLSRSMGLPADYLNTLTNATKSRPGFWETLGDSFATGLGGTAGKAIGSGVGLGV